MGVAKVKTGQRVRVRHEVVRREGDWRSEVVGVVVASGPEQTGSWYAHGRDDKLWLNRIRLRKDDGEITTVAIDEHTDVEIVSEATPEQ